MKKITSLLSALLLLGLFGCSDKSSKSSKEGDVSALESTFATTNGAVDYFTNQPLTEANASVTHAVFAIHGVLRTPWLAYDAVLEAATLEGEENTTLIVAPYFKKLEDNPAEGELYWDSGWTSGYRSQNGTPDRVSSYQVLDELITQVLDTAKYPNLQKITVIGHSAGGQFTQRYAVGTGIDTHAGGIHFRFIVSNPGTYLYLDHTRPSPEYTVCTTFTVPASEPSAMEDTERCVTVTGTYNDYKYGLNSIDASYMDQNTTLMKQNFEGRDVIYLLGTADSDPHHEYLVRDCGADLQGEHRFQRGMNFYNHIQNVIPDNNHSLVKVPERWHSSGVMYPSSSGRVALFGSVADRDHDGFIDSVDNCPDNANNDQNDSDNDGMGDACDADGLDVDGDGIMNLLDNCPTTFNGDQADTNSDGIGDACSTFNDLKIRRVLDPAKIYKTEYCFNIYVENNGTTKALGSVSNGTGWSVTFPVWGGHAPTDASDYWNATYTQNGLSITAEGKYDLDPGEEKNIGLCVQGFDSDEDSIYYPIDNCPHTPNTDQNDSDGNGIGDACETL